MYGCPLAEDMYHIFIHCRRFIELREEARRLLLNKVEKKIDEYKFEESHVMGLLKSAKSFFYNSDIVWPLHCSAYYLGHVPKLDGLVSMEAFTSAAMHRCFLNNIHSEFHIVGIHLTSCIWGMVQRDKTRQREGAVMQKIKG